MCKMNLANKVLLYLLFSANVNHATHCAEINGAMVRIKFSSNASLSLFNKKKKHTHIQFAVSVHNRALVLFYFKAAEKPGQSSE